MAGVERAYDTLRPGTEVDAYVIRKILGAGGFGVTYLAEHRRLGKEFAIKEFFPRAFAFRDGVTVNPRTGGEETYSWGLDRFLQEARALAKFHHHAIVGVSNVFEANGTAYMVLSFEHGQDMRDWLAGLHRSPTQAELDSIVSPILDALTILHASGLLHRDIAPDNIFIRTDGSPLLLDFGAARSALSEHSAQMSAIVKTGYSPPEQYTTEGRDQGPWSDIYAFGATLYWAVTGELPPESTARTLTDRYVTAARKARGTFRQPFLSAIDDALKVAPGQRPRTIADWRRNLENKGDISADNGPPVAPPPKPVVAQAPAATFVASPAAAEPVKEVPADEPTVLAALDLGPGQERKPSALGGIVRFIGKAAAIFIALLGVVLLIGYCAGPGSRVSQGTPVNIASAIADCDRLASIPYDQNAKAPPVEIVKMDAAAAVKTCSTAVASAQADEVPRMRAQLGYALTVNGKAKEAAEALSAAVSADYPAAMALHAELMLEGTVPVGYDANEGCKLAERAMNRGSVNGRALLGDCFANGIGGKQRDPNRAAELYREAVAKDHVVAGILLGIMLRDGAGISQDLTQARKLFEDAERKGDARASYVLGHFYAAGVGVAKDEARSVEIYRRAYAEMEKRAGANEVDGKRFLGLMLLRGDGVPKDTSRAVSLLEAAAVRGSTSAMSTLGQLYDAGEDDKQDHNSALRWLRSAAARDSASAINHLGKMYQDGRGVGRDYAEAMRHYQRAAALGHDDATYNVGELFYDGRGVTQDYATALTWYRRAADLGSGAAMYSIGSMMASGRGIKQNYTEARRWFQRGADFGDLNAMKSMGDLFKEGNGVKKDLNEALNWYRKAADFQLTDAMTSIGLMYRDGEGVTRDYDTALIWFKRAAEKNDQLGAQELGKAYLLGRGVSENHSEAYKWFKRAADQDYPAAINSLGFMHLRGYSVTENPAEAFRLFLRAAELADAAAMHNLANLYETGRGVTKSCSQARTWYTKAIEAGHLESKTALSELSKSKC